MRPLLIAIAAALGALAPGVWACGACIEDKVAATYDQAVIDRAVASKVRGVQVGSLRTSTSPPAFSFVLDSGQDPRAAVSTFRKGVTGQETQLVAIRVVRHGVLRELD